MDSALDFEVGGEHFELACRIKFCLYSWVNALSDGKHILYGKALRKYIVTPLTVLSYDHFVRANQVGIKCLQVFC